MPTDNIPIRPPFGDIFTVNTPEIDKVGQEIYQRDWQRQQMMLQQGAKLDQQFNRDAARLRGEDVNDYSDKYQNWKQSRMDLMRMSPHNQKAYIQKQLEVNKNLADLTSFANQSAEAKKILQLNNSKLASDKNGEYRTDAFDLLSQANSLPTSQWGSLTRKDDNGADVPFDPTNLEHYKYQGNTKDWMPILAKATGIKRPIGYTDPTPTSDKLGTQQAPILAGNSPAQVYNLLLGTATAGAGTPGKFIASHPYTPEEAADIMQRYNDKVLNDPIAQKAWGEGIKLPMNAQLTPIQQKVALVAMETALNNLPEVGKPVPIYDKRAVTQMQEDVREPNKIKNIQLQNLNATHRMYYIQGQINARHNDTKNAVTGVLSDQIDEALNNGDEGAINKLMPKLNSFGIGGRNNTLDNFKYIPSPKNIYGQPQGTGVLQITVNRKDDEPNSPTKGKIVQDQITLQAGDPNNNNIIRGIVSTLSGQKAKLAKDIVGGNKQVVPNKKPSKDPLGLFK